MSVAGDLNDLIVSAQDTFEEVLGWYGLRPYTQLKDRRAETATAARPMDSPAAGSAVARDTASAVTGGYSAAAGRDTAAASVHSRESSAEEADVEVDGEVPVDLTRMAPASASTAAAEQGTITPDVLKTQWGTHKKLVGIRFLFPPLDEQMSLLEKAKIWVARHDYKYFVDWTESDLDTVDPVLRPLSVITRDIYKLHMNRSEYCRNVKLKYCLQSESEWARQFRENLAKSPTEGGFTGLCQAKIVAAELWRKYSEHYRSHQARHPHLRNPKSAAVKSSESDPKTHEQEQTTTGGSYNDTLCTDSDALSDEEDKEEGGRTDKGADTRGEGMLVEEAGAALRRDDEDDEMADESRQKVQRHKDSSDLLKRRAELDLDAPKSKRAKEEYSGDEESRTSMSFDVGKSSNDVGFPVDPSEHSRVINLTKKVSHDPEHQKRGGYAARMAAPETSIKSEMPHDLDSKPELRHAAANPLPYWSMSRLGPLMYQLPVAAYYANPMSCFLDSSLSSSLTSSALHRQIYPFGSASSPDFIAPPGGMENASALTPMKKSTKIRNNSRNELNTEYRRSERGLSYLFPSFSDHNMSLLEKVHITITRHKNNYFLGWDETALDKLDPLVRPKMVVTPEIYKEYCHRNAMKYDSNLQFAMESTEPWAQEFRKKLSLPASEGGFTSLCEVKLEAGRLWREYSGKYRMHNIVKWQMDLNSNAVPTRSSNVRGSADGRCGKFGFRKIQRRQRLKDQRVGLGQRGPVSLQNGIALPVQNGGLGGTPQNGGIGFAQNPHGFAGGHARKNSSCSSPLVESSLSDGASPRAFSRSEPPSVDATHVSRSLDNSPSASGSYDGRASSASFVGDPGCSPTAMQSPRAAVATPRHVEPSSSNDSLFTPLPKLMPVAEQLFIWLERHSNNYFLGFPEESLASLHAYLRPQMVVTREVFQRHVPESMVDVLGKIKWMTSSGDDWAVKFSERLHRSSKDGGFSTFEEALTEAVVLWHINKDKRVQEGTSGEANHVIAGAKSEKAAAASRQSTKDSDSRSEFVDALVGSDLPAASPSPNRRCGQDRFGQDSEPSAAGKFSRSHSTSEDVKEERMSITARQKHHEVRPPSPPPPPSRSRATSPQFALGSVLQLMWNLRQALQVLCRDNPTDSWEQRLVPFFPVLRRVIGASYTVPSSNTSCMVDLTLAALHQRIEEFFSNS